MITCEDGWSWLLTLRQLISTSGDKTQKVTADEAKQYPKLNMGAKTSGNIATFVEDD
jgi:hypothetical protein